jgi:hypothetical protein
MVNVEELDILGVQSAMPRPVLLLARRTIRNVSETGWKSKVASERGWFNFELK